MNPAPRQISTNGQYGFPHPCDISSRIQIFCDGDVLRIVTAYDVDAGWAEVPELDAAGKLIFDRAKQDFVIRRVTGQIKAVLK